MANERIEVQRTIAADPHTIFEVVRDPRGHVAIDSSGMLQDSTASPRRPSATVRDPHGSRVAQRLPARQVRRDRRDHDVRGRSRDRVDDRRADPAADRPHLRLHARADRRRDARDLVLRLVDDRSGSIARPTSSRSSPSSRCAPRSASSPARSSPSADRSREALGEPGRHLREQCLAKRTRTADVRELIVGDRARPCARTRPRSRRACH